MGINSNSGNQLGMKVYVESKDQILEKSADSRGRVTLGSDFANKNVQLAILEVEDDEE